MQPSKFGFVHVTCGVCHEDIALKVPADGFKLWQEGALIQNAMPELSAESRELLISKTCPKCWARMFGGDE